VKVVYQLWLVISTCIFVIQKSDLQAMSRFRNLTLKLKTLIKILKQVKIWSKLLYGHGRTIRDSLISEQWVTSLSKVANLSGSLVKIFVFYWFEIHLHNDRRIVIPGDLYCNSANTMCLYLICHFSVLCLNSTARKKQSVDLCAQLSLVNPGFSDYLFIFLVQWQKQDRNSKSHISLNKPFKIK